MPKIVSFAWTTPALLAGRKTVTRRDWSPDYGRLFRAGDIVIAYDRSPRNGGKPVARLRLTADARLEPDADAPDADWEAEGFAWFWEREIARADRDDPGSVPAGAIADRVSWEGFAAWRRAGGRSWVIRFEVIEVLARPAAPGKRGAPGQLALVGEAPR